MNGLFAAGSAWFFIVLAAIAFLVVAALAGVVRGKALREVHTCKHARWFYKAQYAPPTQDRSGFWRMSAQCFWCKRVEASSVNDREFRGDHSRARVLLKSRLMKQISQITPPGEQISMQEERV